MNLEDNLEDIAGLLFESPYPVFRVSPEGKLLYANEAGKCMLGKGDSTIGQTINHDIAAEVTEALRKNLTKNNVEAKCGERVFSLTLVPVLKGNYVNIYGDEVTARRKAEKELERMNKHGMMPKRVEVNACRFSFFKRE